jgi:hypothetical protein
LTIQFAHDVALAGEVVEVAAGLYTAPVTLNKRITILGLGKGRTIIRAPVTVNVTNTTGTTAPRIRQLSINNNDPATHGLTIATNSIGLEVTGVEITGSKRHGLYATGSGSLVISESEMITNEDDGIHIEGSANITMTDVQFNLNLGDGLQFSGVTGTLTGTRLTARFNGQAGIQVETMPSGQLTIRDSCIVQNASQAGVSLSLIANPATVLIDRSNIFSNLPFEAEAMGVNVNPDMRNNWWGSASGPGSKVTAGIQVSPVATVPFALNPSC